MERDDFVQAIMDLANKCGYDALLDLCAVEYPEDMVGVYNLMNFEDMDMIRVSVHIPKDDSLAAISGWCVQGGLCAGARKL